MTAALQARHTRLRIRLSRPAALFSLLIAAAALVVWAVLTRRANIHTDPAVATAWVAGVSYGTDPTLRQGAPIQRWLNKLGIGVLGHPQDVPSAYSGDPGALEVWFRYQSHIPGAPHLVCHRVGATAFTDNLGQQYPGYLDFERNYVGVYLPGYDHAARTLTCTVRWMPRPPAAPSPASCPMRFTVSLPAAHRMLAAARSLPWRATTVLRLGVTVTVSHAYLTLPLSGDLTGPQRQLQFHVKVTGGELVNSNVVNPLALHSRLPSAPWMQDSQPSAKLTLTDPYGVPLLAQGGVINPMMKLDETGPVVDGDGTTYLAPVNGAGAGTDAVRIHLDVRPNGSSNDLPVDLTVRVAGPARA